MRLPLFAHLSEYVCGHVVFSWTHKAENIQCIRYAHRRGFRRWVLYAFTTFSTHFRFACDCSAGAWMLTVMTCHSWCRRCLYASAWPTFFSHFCPFTKFCTSIMCDAMGLAGMRELWALRLEGWCAHSILPARRAFVVASH